MSRGLWAQAIRRHDRLIASRGRKMDLDKHKRPGGTLPIEPKKSKDMSWRDHLVMLLTIGAAAEHCLMVEYLYAAYSLRADEGNPRREQIERWRAEILAVAR